MSVSVSMQLDLRGVTAGIDGMRSRGKALGQVFRALKPVVREDQREHAKTQSGPDGRWAKRAPSTLQKFARGKSGRRLVRRPLGKLVSAVAYKASRLGVIAESLVKWSGAHQWGGKVGRGSVLPDRPFLWISEKLLKKTADAIEKHALAGFGGR